MPSSAMSEKTIAKTRLRRSTRPKTSSCPRKLTAPKLPVGITRQSTSAAAGSASIAARFARPGRSGTSQAPRISSSPGWTHSIPIVVLAPAEPQLSEQLGDDDDRHARDQAVERAPRREALEREVRLAAAEDERKDDLRRRDHGEPDVEAAPDPRESDRVLEVFLEPAHGSAFPASARTGPGKRPSSRLATALITSGATIQGTSCTS